MRTEIAEFVRNGATPFALRNCEKAIALPVSGYYSDITQQWIGNDAMSALTLTMTAVPGGTDRDMD